MIVTGSLFIEAVKLITSNYSSPLIRSGINQALEAALHAIRAMSQPVRDQNELRAVASSASRGDDRDVEAMMQAWEVAGDDRYIATEVAKPDDIDHDLRTSGLSPRAYERPAG